MRTSSRKENERRKKKMDDDDDDDDDDEEGSRERRSSYDSSTKRGSINVVDSGGDEGRLTPFRCAPAITTSYIASVVTKNRSIAPPPWLF